MFCLSCMVPYRSKYTGTFLDLPTLGVSGFSSVVPVRQSVVIWLKSCSIHDNGAFGMLAAPAGPSPAGDRNTSSAIPTGPSPADETAWQVYSPLDCASACDGWQSPSDFPAFLIPDPPGWNDPLPDPSRPMSPGSIERGLPFNEPSLNEPEAPATPAAAAPSRGTVRGREEPCTIDLTADTPPKSRRLTPTSSEASDVSATAAASAADVPTGGPIPGSSAQEPLPSDMFMDPSSAGTSTSAAAGVPTGGPIPGSSAQEPLPPDTLIDPSSQASQASCPSSQPDGQNGLSDSQGSDFVPLAYLMSNAGVRDQVEAFVAHEQRERPHGPVAQLHMG